MSSAAASSRTSGIRGFEEACKNKATIAAEILRTQFFFGNFITKYAGHTPKLGERISKNETSFFENRIFGVEIYCGPISEEVLIHTNELVRGGANLTVELQRRGKFYYLFNTYDCITYMMYV